jgi:hypothetical protein
MFFDLPFTWEGSSRIHLKYKKTLLKFSDIFGTNKLNMINSKSLIDISKFLIPIELKRIIKKNYLQYFRGSFSLNFQDKKMLKYLKKQNGYFIEIGANNGIDQSNTYLLELKKNWKGILVEPSPNKFIECIKNRSSKNKFYCNACVSFDYKEKYVPITYSNLMTI